MKKLLATLVAVLLVITGCSSGKGSDTVNEYKYVYTTDITQLDYTATMRATNGDHFANFVDGLFENDNLGRYVPALAEGEPTVSDDGLNYTYKLKPGIKWVTNEGVEYDEVKPSDFVTGLKHAVDVESELLYIVADSIDGLAAYIKDPSLGIESVGVKADDAAMTLTYTLANPEPYFNTKTTYGILFPISEKFLTSKGDTFGSASPDSILYNGPFILANSTEKTKIEYTKNQNYWDKDNVFLEKVEYTFFDGKDPDALYRAFSDGTYTQARVYPASAGYADVVKNDKDNINASQTDSSTFNMTFNFNRGAYKYTSHSETSRVDAQKAIKNLNFRTSLMFAMDRASYLAQNVGDDMKEISIRNMLTPSEFLTIGNKTYGEVTSEKLAALNPELYTGIDLKDGHDAFYNVEKAKATFEKAKAELEAQGVAFPIQLDMPVNNEAEIGMNQAKSLKASIEKSLGTDNVVINLQLISRKEYMDITYYATSGAASDFDISTASGWGADFIDPSTYLNIYNPTNGDMLNTFGLDAAVAAVGGDPANVAAKELIGLNKFEAMLEKANAITDKDQLDARNEAYAEAEAWLAANVLQIPIQAGGGTPFVSKVVPFTRPSGFAGLGKEKLKFMKVQKDVVSIEQYTKAKEEWEKKVKAGS
ncbi:peptide ABC transporter substrate-binding protein [Erysipelothrix sp. HDW6A]|uniref:peptide ABC transporter substrate-binding protein n=1 Tax=Erysipelothrix sp. HDW6A TaxID=2714928 RepID=UPI00140BF37D|nr:peptide ABC transporter substrate-binding protein [Erysipelothrix sp. HDW6A]QIK57733.1 peptide ABC transporter substrate-binding protein [Erysipelothrix sp. HDW6A]